MRRTPFNRGWEIRRHASFFLEMVGAAVPWQQVALPHVTASAEGCAPLEVEVAAR